MTAKRLATTNKWRFRFVKADIVTCTHTYKHILYYFMYISAICAPRNLSETCNSWIKYIRHEIILRYTFAHMFKHFDSRQERKLTNLQLINCTQILINIHFDEHFLSLTVNLCRNQRQLPDPHSSPFLVPPTPHIHIQQTLLIEIDSEEYSN